MTAAEWAPISRLLRSSWPQRDTDPGDDAYVEVLAEFDAVAVRGAVTKLTRSCRFTPRPAEIVAALGQQKRANEARNAAAWLAEHAPDLDDGMGRVCPFAVAVALRLRHEGRVTVGLVRQERAAWMRRQGLGEFVGGGS